MELPLKKLNKHDIPGLIDLSTSIGWDYDEDEITTILSSGRIFGHKNEEGEIVSSSAIIEYDSKLASIGMVIVRHDYRGLGLGRKATEKCIESVPRNITVMLIATEEGKPMYEKMGFNPIDSVHKFLCEKYRPLLSSRLNNINIELIGDEDIPQLSILDDHAFGDNRRNFLINRIKQAKDALIVKSSDGNIIGYGLSILGPVNLIVGPIVAPDAQIAHLIIDNLARNYKGRIRIDVPSGNELFMSQLEQSGFSKVSQPSIMIKNSNELPLRNQTLYGIAAQIFG
jgi:predicted N-acetyltransferase YhbS